MKSIPHWLLRHKRIQDFLYKQERGDAELLESLFHQDFLYDHIAHCWLCCENGVWNQDQEKQTLRIAVEDSRVYLEASSKTDWEITRLMSEKNEANQEKIARLEALRDRLRGRVNKLNNRNRITNVLKMAESGYLLQPGSSIGTR